jgi:hypothetical protein
MSFQNSDRFANFFLSTLFLFFRATYMTQISEGFEEKSSLISIQLFLRSLDPLNCYIKQIANKHIFGYYKLYLNYFTYY